MWSRSRCIIITAWRPCCPDWHWCSLHARLSLLKRGLSFWRQLKAAHAVSYRLVYVGLYTVLIKESLFKWRTVNVNSCIGKHYVLWVSWLNRYVSQAYTAPHCKLYELYVYTDLVYTVSKKDLTLKRYSSKSYGSILMSFGRNIQKTPE